MKSGGHRGNAPDGHMARHQFGDLEASQLLEHLDQLLLTHSLPQLLSHSLDVVNIDETGSIIVEQVEDLVDAALSYRWRIPWTLCRPILR